MIFVQLLDQYGLSAACGMIALENAGVPLPTELAYVVVQASVVSGGSSYAWALLATTLAGTAGSLVSYGVGRYLARHSHRHPASSGIQQRLVGWYRKYGPATVIATCFLGHVRPWSSYVAGLAELEFLPFTLYTLIGSLAFSALSLVVMGAIVKLWNTYGWTHGLIIGLSAIGFFAAFGLIRFQTSKKKEPK
jgi:membrane protein DedA with SNARE-associated domain